MWLTPKEINKMWICNVATWVKSAMINSEIHNKPKYMYKFSYRFFSQTRKIVIDLLNLQLFARMPGKWTKTDLDSDRILGLPLVARNWRARKAFILMVTRGVKVRLRIVLLQEWRCGVFCVLPHEQLVWLCEWVSQSLCFSQLLFFCFVSWHLL